MYESVCVFKCNQHRWIISSGSQELMIKLKPRKPRQKERERESRGGREVCVILSMLFVLTSCSLLPDRKDRSERPAAFNKTERKTSRGEDLNPAEENQIRGFITTVRLNSALWMFSLFYPLYF